MSHSFLFVVNAALWVPSYLSCIRVLFVCQMHKERVWTCICNNHSQTMATDKTKWTKCPSSVLINLLFHLFLFLRDERQMLTYRHDVGWKLSGSRRMERNTKEKLNTAKTTITLLNVNKMVGNLKSGSLQTNYDDLCPVVLPKDTSACRQTTINHRPWATVPASIFSPDSYPGSQGLLVPISSSHKAESEKTPKRCHQ